MNNDTSTHVTPTVNIDQLLLKKIMEMDLNGIDQKYELRLALLDIKKIVQGLNLIKSIAQTAQIKRAADMSMGKDSYLGAVDGIEQLILTIDDQLRVYLK
jgi:hypothetical protein